MTEKKEEKQESILPETKKKIEAILFSAGRVVSLAELKKLCNLTSEVIVKEAVGELIREYKERSSPLLIVPEGDGWKLTTREKYLPLVQQINPHTELSKSILETLAVIAWKQPILQSELIRIRTNKAYDDVKELVELGYISKEKRGRSFILKPTGKFFDYFDLPTEESAKDLFKGFEDVKETQKKIEETLQKKQEEAKKEKIKKLGKLKVYQVTEEEKKEESTEPGEERTGKLEVYEGEKEEAIEEETEEKEEIEEEKLEETEIPEVEETEEQAEEEKEEHKAEETEERRLHPELEEFAEEEEKQEPEEEKEEEKETEEKKDEETEEAEEERDEFYRKKKKGPGIDDVIEKHKVEEKQEPEETEEEQEAEIVEEPEEKEE